MRQQPSPRASPAPEPTLRGTIALVALFVGPIVFASYPALVTAALAGAATTLLVERLRCWLSAACGATHSPLEAARSSATS